MSNMWPMMKGFARDFIAYRGDLAAHDAWIRKTAAAKGWSVNPRWMVYTNLRLWLSDCEQMYGKRYCPCFEPSGDAEADRALICPCTYAQAEIDSTGWCHCTLFGRADLTPADYARAEKGLMCEYRDAPLTWNDGILDTRNREIDPLRKLPIPDAIHQVKRVLNGKGTPLRAMVATHAEAGHLARLAEMRGITCAHEEQDGGVLVRLG